MAIKDDVFNSIVALRPTTTAGRRLARLRGVDNSQVPQLDNDLQNVTTETVHKLNTELNTNRTQIHTQTEHKLDTNYTQQKVNQTQTEHKPNTQPHTEPDTNRTQTEHEPDTKLNTTQSISTLAGLQREILFFIYKECRTSRSKITEPLTLDHIATTLNIRLGSIKTTIQRLVEKRFLSRVEFKNGRGGWAKYELPDNTYREILQLETEHKLYTNRAQTIHKPDTQPDTQPDTNSPNNNNDLNINKNIIINELPDEWQKINIEPLQQWHFSIRQIKQIYDLNITTPEIVQDSIYQFAYTLRFNPSSLDTYPNKLSALMGVLRRGEAWIESNYVPPKIQATRDLLERRKKEDDELRQIEQELFKLESEKWLQSLSESQIKTIAPRYTPEKGLTSGLIRGALIEHFKQHIWTNKLAEIKVNTVN